MPEWRFDCQFCPWFVVVGNDPERGVNEAAFRLIEDHNSRYHSDELKASVS